MSEPVELRCPSCGRFHAEFPQGISADVSMRFAPHPKCSLKVFIIRGRVRWVYPGEIVPDGFDTQKRVA